MLRYHMVVITADNVLRRSIRRVSAATGSSVDFVAGARDVDPASDVHLAIFDSRLADPGPDALAHIPAGAQIIHLIEGDSLMRRISLLDDERVTSLLCFDERFDDDEFIASATKALRGEIFGLQKAFPWGVTTLSMVLRSYGDKHAAIEVLSDYAASAGCRGSVRDRIQLVCDELMINALYHAPRDESGGEKHADKTPQQMSQIPALDPVEVQYGCSGKYFGVSIRDGSGSLTREKLLDYLARAAAPAAMEDKKSGAGLGLVTVLRSVSRLIFNCDPGSSTEVIALFDMELLAQGKAGARSLHVFRAAQQPERRNPAAGRRKGDVLQARAPGSSNNLLYVGLVLLGLSVFAVTMMAIRPRDGEPSAQGEQSLTVYLDPEDATAQIDGESIENGARVPLLTGTESSAVLTVERPGYVGRTIQLLRADAKNHVLRISLTREP